MFDIERHRHEYHHQFCTVIPDIFPGDLCKCLVDRLTGLIEDDGLHYVDHEGQGTRLELDASGKYRHYLADGSAIRQHFPELKGAYHSLTPLIAAITSDDVVVSPYADSDINIKAYPPNGGTVGKPRHERHHGTALSHYK